MNVSASKRALKSVICYRTAPKKQPLHSIPIYTYIHRCMYTQLNTNETQYQHRKQNQPTPTIDMQVSMQMSDVFTDETCRKHSTLDNKTKQTHLAWLTESQNEFVFQTPFDRYGRTGVDDLQPVAGQLFAKHVDVVGRQLPVPDAVVVFLYHRRYPFEEVFLRRQQHVAFVLSFRLQVGQCQFGHVLFGGQLVEEVARITAVRFRIYLKKKSGTKQKHVFHVTRANSRSTCSRGRCDSKICLSF